MIGEFIPYYHLDPEQRAELHGWLLDHRIDYHRVPAYEQFTWDAATGEWRIPLYWHNTEGRMQINPDGETVRMLVVRRRELWPLPWPRVALRLERPTVSINGVDLTPYVRNVVIGGA
ncbi:hypothetical protein GCM10010168_86110 [Actinoplanes ianthinogenes]|uniref:Uncharacterized protein n=1 Tax=Actinoplanes ianthinogenes TaxID=122358 RepID=A0ABM7M157_9ACTN|nr:hypothetical protein [Actinoplanes ianthinogenes]BCJ45342.1 hypothetical protein Aiant_59990 [Actinoplanes ianthinogenes]GGR53900.1 hypothetical protein GCM10010168_86110 [Actinoplanes ianthinogenes]